MSTAAKTPLNEPPNLTAALELLERGFWPVPIYPPTHRGASPGKRPIGYQWGEKAPTPESLRSTWRQHPEASIGLLLGPDSGVSDFEVDGPEGESTWLDLCGGEIIETMGWSSHKGPHRLVAYDTRFADFPSVIEHDSRFPGLSLRLGGGSKQIQSVCPPSLQTIEQPDGRVIPGPPREWNGCTHVARLPAHIVDEIARRLALPKKKPVAKKAGLYAPAIIADAYGQRAFNDEIANVRSAGKGGRNNQLNDSAFRLGQLVEMGKLDRKTVEAGLKLAAEQAGLPADESEKTIRSGIEAGIAKPRDPIPDRTGVATKATKATEAHPLVASVAYVACPPAPGDQDEPIPERKWPSPPSMDAFHGAAGELALGVKPFTEADPVGILAQTLIAFGNMVGRSPCFYVGATRHGLNEFVCTAGPTGQGRKGTAKDVVTYVFSAVDSAWHDNCIQGGLASGEGLIWAIRDPIYKKEPIKDKGRIIDYQDLLVDEGVADKRLLCIETEFGGTLKILAREGNTLSAVMRQAWDNGFLRNMTKGSPAKSTGGHVSMIVHVTEQEVAKLLTSTDAANGFANRFLWVCVRQAQRLSRGSRIPISAYGRTIEYIRAAHRFVQEHSRPADGSDEPRDIEFRRSEDADEYWDRLYHNEFARSYPGLLGAVLGRAEPHVMRLACIYALIDGTPLVQVVHLKAAYAFWEYCVRSAAYIFGDNLGDRDAETLLSALRAAPEGLSQTEIVQVVFQRHKNRVEVARTIGRLLEIGLIRSEKRATNGRPATVWFASTPGDLSDLSDLRSPEQSPDDRTLMDAVDWLRGYLSDRPATESQAIGDAGECGISRDALMRASAAIGVKVTADDDARTWSL
jgi:hypothetical protein